MCGIAGSLNFNFSIESILASQTHRGPDVSQYSTIELTNKSQLHLGHNRLKIICLSDEANQPLRDNTGNHYLVFNGEIYNYLELRETLQQLGVEFKTTSDSEVLLQALIHWGMDAIHRFNGMFAFAYFNASTQSLYIARDRFGVKPLYYYANDSQLMFASTSQPIASALDLKPCYEYLKRGLRYGIYEDHSELTAYLGLKSVSAGCYLEFSLLKNAHPKKIRYYDLHQSVIQKQAQLMSLNQSQMIEYISETFSSACALRLNADVPVSVALSGGLDSSAVASIAKQHKKDLTAFCFGNPTDKASEGRLAQALSAQHGIETHFIEPKLDDWVDGFDAALEHQDAPFAGLSIVAQYLLYQDIKQQGFKVVLGGQGGDEAFLGYRKFQLFYLRELVDNRNWVKAFLFFHSFSQMLWAERNRMRMFWQLRSKYTTRVGIQNTLDLPGDTVSFRLGYSGDIQKRQIDDILNYSLPTLLRYEDRNSMAHSIESRLPFMDYRLMELACALPIAMKLKKGYGKWCLREIMQDKIPNSIRLARYKRGFDVAQSQAVYRALARHIQPILLDHRALLESYMPKTNLASYFSAESLHQTPQRFVELTTLLWLAKRS